MKTYAQRGSVLLMTLFIFGMFLVMMIAAIGYVSGQFKGITNQKEAQQAFQVAESGVDYTLFLLRSQVRSISDLVASEPIEKFVQDLEGDGVVGSFIISFAAPSDAPASDVIVVTAFGRPQNLPVCEGLQVRIELNKNGDFVITRWAQLPSCSLSALPSTTAAPTATLTPTPTATSTPTPTATPTPTPIPTPTPTPTPTPEPTLIPSGPNNPGTVVEDVLNGASVTWTGVDNVKTSNDVYATAPSNFQSPTKYLKATNFGFAIPANAVVKGIKVEVEARKVGQGGGSYRDQTVQIVTNQGVIGFTNRGNNTQLENLDTYRTYGGTADLWGETWTPAAINSPNFGVALSYASSTNTSFLSVDHVRITVYYTP